MQQTHSSRSGPSEGEQVPVLSLSHAAKTFGPVVALADGTIHIEAGEIHALVGENGAGKSTLVKILAGLHHPDSGDFQVAGTPSSSATLPRARTPESPSSTRNRHSSRT